MMYTKNFSFLKRKNFFNIFILLSILLTILINSENIFAQKKSGGKVHGYVFGDYFYKISGDSTNKGSQYSHLHQDQQAFQFRRLYLYYDHNITEKVFTQFLLEGNDKIFEPSGKHSIFIKTAYLEWKDIIPYGSIAFGLVPTHIWSWGLSERTWKHRFIEKTIADFRGFSRASDIGISIQGKFTENGKFGYNAMVGNGSGQGEEKNKYKNFYGGINFIPIKSLLFEIQTEFEPSKNNTNRFLLKGFSAYQTKNFTIGAEIVKRTFNDIRKTQSASTDSIPFGFSIFTFTKLTDKINAFARYDYFDPDLNDKTSGFKENFFVFGIDYMPIKELHIAPNIWINTFSDKSTNTKIVNRRADIIGRLTFYYIYK